MTPKACQLLKQLEPGRSYVMSDMGDLIFPENKNHSRQTIALKAGRFARQLIDRGYLDWTAKRAYRLTDAGIKVKLQYTGNA